MKFKMAVAGFRHGHIFDIVARTKDNPVLTLVAACEEDEQTRAFIEEKGIVKITHTDYKKMLESVECDIIAIGDCYGKRGEIAIEALKKGRHIISDKPLCTRISEIKEIARICAEKNLKVGCQLNMRNMAQFIGLRNLIKSGDLKEIHSIIFTGHHPLMLDSRPSWYFQPGMHGGTINDIGIHAIDYILWATGMKFSKINAARSWNAFAKKYPHFKDAGQMMLSMENGCGVLGDVSYFSPDSHGYNLRFYWRFVVYGTGGIAETSATAKNIIFAQSGKTEVSILQLPASDDGGYLRDFLDDIRGATGPERLKTQDVIIASYITLLIQHAGDENKREIDITDLPVFYNGSPLKL
ncbi:MAG: Gfo/Idh/MocA family oxidoreductase [Candidatus Omnitrophica bacterium]|nr:Gfo/Idh/MocA family oxidoreductase [Candidatus Omnitrophota bacterium]